MVKTLIAICIAAVLLLTIVTPAQADIMMTFEEFVGSDIGNAGTPIGTFYSGLTFETLSPGLSDWVGRDHSNFTYNTHSVDLGTGTGGYDVYGNGFATTALDTTGDGGKVTFDNADATYVELLYTANSSFYLTAYAADNTQLGQAIGGNNFGYGNGMDLLRVDWNGTNHIAYFTVHDMGNYWLVDNIKTDATGIVVPVPGAVLLGMIGLSVAGIKLRKSV